MTKLCSLISPRQILLRMALSFMTLIVLLAQAGAHEIQPAVADMSFSQDQKYTISIVLNLEAIMANIEPEVSDTSESQNAPEYDRLRALPSDDLIDEFSGFRDSFLSKLNIQIDDRPVSVSITKLLVPEIGDLAFTRESVITLSGDIPANASKISWGWAREFGPSIIRVSADTDEDPYSAYLVEGQQSDPIPIEGKLSRGVIETIANYISVGYVHIVPKGLDHILFVVGLFLLSTRLHPLLWQVTAFTVAHTVSLALGITGVVTVPPAIVEPLIALSIVYVAVENIYTQKLSRWRPVIVFCFGLLHGLGFAGVLSEIGLPADQFVTGLISFNVGVELGQLSVIAVCFLLVGFWFSKKPWYHKFIVIPASITIGIIAGWWFIERTFLG